MSQGLQALFICLSSSRNSPSHITEYHPSESNEFFQTAIIVLQYSLQYLVELQSIHPPEKNKATESSPWRAPYTGGVFLVAVLQLSRFT